MGGRGENDWLGAHLQPHLLGPSLTTHCNHCQQKYGHIPLMFVPRLHTQPGTPAPSHPVSSSTLHSSLSSYLCHMATFWFPFNLLCLKFQQTDHLVGKDNVLSPVFLSPVLSTLPSKQSPEQAFAVGLIFDQALGI